jgi:hypothetical protein
MKSLLLAALVVLSLAQGLIAPVSAADDTAITFRIDDGVLAEDETYVREGIRLAQIYLEEVFTDTVDSTVIVNVKATSSPVEPGLIAEATDGFIAYFTRSIGWAHSAPVYRLEVVIHEFIHVYQGELLAVTDHAIPAWIIEGTAEYLSSDALVERGLLDQADADDYRLWAMVGAPLDDLATYESFAAFQRADPRVYAVSYLGVAALVRDHGVGRIGAFYDLVRDGSTWEAAFEDAFEITPAAFYRRFERDRADFAAPDALPPVYDTIDPVESASPVEITDLMERVAPGEQFLMLARSEPNARCIAYLWGPYLDLVHETTVDGASNLFWLVTIPSGTPPQTVELSVDCGAGAIVREIKVLPRSRAEDHRG